MAANDSMFDSMGRFSGSSCPMIVEVEGLSDVAMATNFATKVAITGFV